MFELLTTTLKLQPSLLASGMVGGLALLVLILMTTVIVFGIKFLLDRNLAEFEREDQAFRDADQPQRKTESNRPLYTVKPIRAQRRSPTRKSPTHYTLEPVPAQDPPFDRQWNRERESASARDRRRDRERRQDRVRETEQG